jgi:hypothetical protein
MVHFVPGGGVAWLINWGVRERDGPDLAIFARAS